MFTVGAIIDRPQATAKQKPGDQWSPLQTNFGRELVSSADLWYNGANEKPLPLGEVAAKPTERAKWWQEYALSPAIAGSLPKGEP